MKKKGGIDTYAERVCRRRRDRGGEKAKAKSKKQKAKAKAKATDFFMMPEGKALSFAAKS